MKLRKTMLGERFGKWTVIEEGPERIVKAQCDCGKQKMVTRSNLITGRSKSCGCSRFRYIQGNTYGCLTVLEDTFAKEVKVQCECGAIKMKNRNALKSRPQICRCSSRLLKGNRYGKLVVIEDALFPNLVAQCDCGNIINVAAGNIKRGHTRSCGCLRGRFSRKANSERSKFKENREGIALG